jgi:hypothetical protein
MDNKFSIDYIKTHRVAIFVTSSEEVKICDKLLGWRHYYYYDNFQYKKHCISETQNGSEEVYIRDKYEIINARDFIEYNSGIINMRENSIKTEITVMKEDTKELIGYKLKYPEYIKAISEIIGFAFNREGFETNIGKFQTTLFKLKEASVIDIWFEPIYIEKKFEIGQWVYWSGVNPTFGRIVSYSSSIKNDAYYFELDNTVNDNNLYRSPNLASLRLASENEIKLHLIHLFEEKGYKGNKFKVLVDKYKNEISTYNIPNNKLKFIYYYDSDEFKVSWDNSITYTIYLKGVWAEIVKDDYISCYFGEVEFKLYKGNNLAITEHGRIPMVDIKKAIDYIENPPKLAEYVLSIHSDKFSGYIKFHDIDKNEIISIGFGCKKGKLSELKLIYEAYCKLNDIDN